jgi:predicted MFS family arabinose efflux permease
MNQTSQPEVVAAPPRKTIIIALFIVFLYWLSLYLYVPTLPVYVQSKTSDLVLVGTVLSMYGLWQLIARLPVGIGADALGSRKPFLIGCLVLVGAGAWMMSSANGAYGVLFGRAVTGVGAGAWVVLVVLFTSLYPAQDTIRATALLTVINSLGRITGTSLTGVLNIVGGYPLAFRIATGTALLAIIFSLLLPEKKRKAEPLSLKKIGRMFIRPAVIIPSLLSAVLHYVDWTATFSFTPIIAKQYGAGNITLSLLTTLNLGMVLLGSTLSTATAKRWGASRLLIGCFIFLAIGLAGLTLAPSLPYVFVAQLCIGFAFGMGYPIMMGLSIQRVEAQEQASAMGLHQSVYALGMFAGPWLSGILAKAIGIQPMFAVTAVAILIVGLVGARLINSDS